MLVYYALRGSCYTPPPGPYLPVDQGNRGRLRSRNRKACVRGNGTEAGAGADHFSARGAGGGTASVKGGAKLDQCGGVKVDQLSM